MYFKGDADDLDSIQKQMQVLAEETERLEKIQQQVEEQMNVAGIAAPSKDADDRSIYVGNVSICFSTISSPYEL